jgi:hypothetical protein
MAMTTAAPLRLTPLKINAVPTVRDIHSAHAYRGGSKLAAGRNGAARSQTRSAEYKAVDLHASADLRGGAMKKPVG